MFILSLVNYMFVQFGLLVFRVAFSPKLEEENDVSTDDQPTVDDEETTVDDEETTVDDEETTVDDTQETNVDDTQETKHINLDKFVPMLFGYVYVIGVARNSSTTTVVDEFQDITDFIKDRQILESEQERIHNVFDGHIFLAPFIGGDLYLLSSEPLWLSLLLKGIFQTFAFHTPYYLFPCTFTWLVCVYGLYVYYTFRYILSKKLSFDNKNVYYFDSRNLIHWLLSSVVNGFLYMSFISNYGFLGYLTTLFLTMLPNLDITVTTTKTKNQ